MDRIFFNLICLYIGTGGGLSYYPSAKEWSELYKIAHKQCLVGVCFAVVRRHMEVTKAEWKDAGILSKLYMQWLASAVQIQRQNELMNLRCEELQAALSSYGLRNAILKGHAMAALYHMEGMQGDTLLNELRQSGDIDVYVDCGRERAYRHVMIFTFAVVIWIALV